MMFSAYFKSAFLLTIFVSLGEGFFHFGRKASAPRESQQWPQYSVRGDGMMMGGPGAIGWPPQMSLQGQMPFAFDGTSPTAVTVALPVAVPIQASAHMTKMSSPAMTSSAAQPQLHNVQLVPCLCPVSKDYDPLPQAPAPSAPSPSTASFAAAAAAAAQNQQ